MTIEATHLLAEELGMDPDEVKEHVYSWSEWERQEGAVWEGISHANVDVNSSPSQEKVPQLGRLALNS